MSTKKNQKNKKTDSMITKVFKLYDIKKAGFLDFSLLPEMLRAAGGIFLDKELEPHMEKIRTANGSDTFNLKDFTQLCEEFSKNDETPEDLIEAFRFWDTDGSGKITTEDIRKALTTLGDALSEDEINALIREADPSNIGVIDYEAYSNLLFKKIT